MVASICGLETMVFAAGGDSGTAVASAGGGYCTVGMVAMFGRVVSPESFSTSGSLDASGKTVSENRSPHFAHLGLYFPGLASFTTMLCWQWGQWSGTGRSWCKILMK